MKFSSLFEAESTGKGISPLTTNEPISGPDIIEPIATPKTPKSVSEVTEQKQNEKTNDNDLSEEGNFCPN